MHSFSVNIRICHSSKILSAEVNLDGHEFLGLTNPDVYLKRMHQLYIINFVRCRQIFKLRDLKHQTFVLFKLYSSFPGYILNAIFAEIFVTHVYQHMVLVFCAFACWFYT